MNELFHFYGIFSFLGFDISVIGLFVITFSFILYLKNDLSAEIFLDTEVDSYLLSCR